MSSESTLALTSISMDYGGVRALHEVGFELRQGEVVGLIGPNGSGKTTMLNVASGWRKPTKGTVSIDGMQLPSGPDNRARAGIYRTFQTIRLFDGISALDHLVLVDREIIYGGLFAAAMRLRGSGTWRRAQERAETRLREAGLDPTCWNVPVGELSYGNRRLVEIVRALCCEPKFLLLDEPTAGMNPSESTVVSTLVGRAVTSGCGVLLVEHNLPVVRDLCDRLVVLDRGIKLVEGPSSDVFSDVGVQRAYLGGEDVASPRAAGVGRRDAAVLSEPLLSVESLEVSYGKIKVASGVDLDVSAGEVCALLGPNGAGKTSTIMGLMGMVSTSGTVRLGGKDISRASSHKRVGAGLALVPEGRRVFGPLTVVENLQIATRGSSAGRSMEDVLRIFPRLGERRNQQAGVLSGGEQQMLAIARALVQDPRVLLIDEPSMGLAPLIRSEIYESLSRLAGEGIAVLVADQNVTSVLNIASRGYLMDRGRIVNSWRGEAPESLLINVVLGAE